MKTKQLFAVGMAALMLMGCGSSAGRIRFGAAGLGGMYQAFGDAFAKLAEEGEGTDPIEVRTTAGSAANIRLLSEDYVQMAIAQADMAEDAYAGTGVFADGETYTNFSAVAGLYTEACQVAVRADSEIVSIEDLQGKTVSIGEEESGTEQNARQILEAYGLGDRLVEMKYFTYTEAADALQKGEIDAMFCTAGVQTTVLEELTRQCEIRFLNVDGEGAGRLLSAYPAYETYVIPADTYYGQTEEVSTVGVKALLLASDKLSAKTVKQITGLLFGNSQKLQYALPLDLVLDESSSTDRISIPFHPGAADYYKECGIDVTSKEGNK